VTELGPPPPALVVKVNVAATPVLPATRSPAAMPNEIEVTAPPITPLDTALEGVGSALVFTVTSPAALAGPNVQPASVTVTAVPAESAVPVTDNTMDVPPGVCGVRLVPGDDEVAVGVAEVEKKPDG
jgi:hypothetical protein